jgi:hypothetical protein
MHVDTISSLKGDDYPPSTSTNSPSELLALAPPIAMIGTERRGTHEESILDNLATHHQGNTNQKIWQAVIDSAIADWVRGTARHKLKAEYFLFQDEDDFPYVCRSAGLDPASVRESLWAIRAHAACDSSRDAA